MPLRMAGVQTVLQTDIVNLCSAHHSKMNSELRLPVTNVTSSFCTGRRPKPEIVASKEQQIQRDDPGTSTQSSNQSDNSRLSRKGPPELGKEGEGGPIGECKREKGAKSLQVLVFSLSQALTRDS